MNHSPFEALLSASRWFAVIVPSTRWCSCWLVSPHVAHGVRHIFSSAFVSVICFGFTHDRVWTTAEHFYWFCLSELASLSIWKYLTLNSISRHLLSGWSCLWRRSLSLSQGNGKFDEPCAGRDCRAGCKCLPEKGSRVSQRPHLPDEHHHCFSLHMHKIYV